MPMAVAMLPVAMAAMRSDIEAPFRGCRFAAWESMVIPAGSNPKMGFAHWNVPYFFFAPTRGAANRRRGCSMVPLCGTRIHGFTVGMHPPFSF